ASFGDKYAVNTGVLAKYLLLKLVQKGAANRCNLNVRRSICLLLSFNVKMDPSSFGYLFLTLAMTQIEIADKLVNGLLTSQKIV
ncbi:MAG: hypothetical protein FD128_963, partial [Hyphomonadaceae bacterium]